MPKYTITANITSTVTSTFDPDELGLDCEDAGDIDEVKEKFVAFLEDDESTVAQALLDGTLEVTDCSAKIVKAEVAEETEEETA